MPRDNRIFDATEYISYHHHILEQIKNVVKVGCKQNRPESVFSENFREHEGTRLIEGPMTSIFLTQLIGQNTYTIIYLV